DRTLVGFSTAQAPRAATTLPLHAALPISNSATPAPGQWYAIYFDTMSVDAIDLLDHVIVEYAGGGYSANVRVVSVSPTIRNSTIGNGSAYGNSWHSGTSTVDRHTFTDNAQ